MGLLSWLYGPVTSKRKEPVVSTGRLSTNRGWELPKKRHVHSIGFHDEIITVTWRDQKEPERFKMTPFRHNSFIDSGEFYLIGLYLEQEPQGFTVKFNDETFEIKRLSNDSNKESGTN